MVTFGHAASAYAGDGCPGDAGGRAEFGHDGLGVIDQRSEIECHKFRHGFPTKLEQRSSNGVRWGEDRRPSRFMRKNRFKAPEQGGKRTIFNGFPPLVSLALYLHIFVSA